MVVMDIQAKEPVLRWGGETSRPIRPWLNCLRRVFNQCSLPYIDDSTNDNTSPHHVSDTVEPWQAVTVSSPFPSSAQAHGRLPQARPGGRPMGSHGKSTPALPSSYLHPISPPISGHRDCPDRNSPLLHYRKRRAQKRPTLTPARKPVPKVHVQPPHRPAQSHLGRARPVRHIPPLVQLRRGCHLYSWESG